MSDKQTSGSGFDPSRLSSSAAKASDPPYFHRQPDTIRYDFDQGIPDRKTYPIEILKALAVEAISEPHALDYHAGMNFTDMSLGDAEFRKQIAAYLDRRDGTNRDPDGIMIVHGSGHGLSLIARGYLEKGDAVFVESVTFPFGLRYFGSTGASVIPVDMDADGMKIDALEQAIATAAEEGLRPKLVYVIATHQLPTGAILSLARRKTLLDLAERHDLIIHEDNVYREHGPGSDLPTLLGMDRSGRVLQTDSFAKTVAPAIRIGWVAGTAPAMIPLAKVREDLGTSMWLQRIMTKYLAQGHHDRHIAGLRDGYAQKRAIATKALRDYCAPHITFEEPRGGWYYWLELNEAVDWERVQAECARRGIAMRPGEMFSKGGQNKPHMRLAVGHVEPDMIVEGIRTLGEVLQSVQDSATA